MVNDDEDNFGGKAAAVQLCGQDYLSFPRKEQHIIRAKTNGANGRCIYVPGLPLSSFSLHFDILGLTLSIVSEILVINIQ